MKDFTVSQYINVRANNEEEAAIEARKLQLLPDAKALTFHVSDSSNEVTKVTLVPSKGENLG